MTALVLRRALARGDRNLKPLEPYPHLLKLATIECANEAQLGNGLYSEGASGGKRRKLVQTFQLLALAASLPTTRTHAWCRFCSC